MGPALAWTKMNIKNDELPNRISDSMSQSEPRNELKEQQFSSKPTEGPTSLTFTRNNRSFVELRSLNYSKGCSINLTDL